MPQSNIIFGMMLFAFILFITDRGELPKYMALFSKKAQPKTPVKASGGVLGMLGSLF